MKALQKWTILGVALAALALPAVAQADRYDRGHRHYDRGDRYRHGDYHGRSNWSFSFGFGNHGWRDYSYGRISYGSGYRHYPRYSYHYSYAPVRYYAPAYCPPPVYYSPPVYYEPCRPTYYSEVRYYYGR